MSCRTERGRAAPAQRVAFAAIATASLLVGGAQAQQRAGEAPRLLTLREAVQETVLHNPNRVRAGHEVSAAGFQRDAAEWGRFPTLSVQAAQRSSSSQLNAISPPTTVRLDQPLWAGGRIDAQIDAARAQTGAAESAEGETRRRLAEQTATAYLDWLGAAERFDIAEKAADYFQGLLRYVRQREDKGLASAADVAIAGARYNSVVAQAADLRGQLERARAQLANLTLITAPARGVAVRVPPQEADMLAAAEPAYLDKSPLVAQRRAELDSARAQIGVRKGQMFPSVALRLERLSGLGPTFPSGSESRALFVLQFSPDPGLASYSGYQTAASRAESAAAQLQADENDVRLRARSDRADYGAARQQTAELEPQVQALNTAAGSYMRQFEAGRKSWLEVLNTYRERLDTELLLSRTRTTRDQAALRLMVNTGTFWPWLETLPR